MRVSEKKAEVVNEKTTELREFEQFYTNNKVDTMFDTINKKKKE